MKVQANDVKGSFETGFAGALSIYDITIDQSVTSKIDVLFQNYDLMGFTIIGDWDDIQTCKAFVESFAKTKTLALAEKWEQFYDVKGNTLITPTHNKTINKDEDHNSFSMGEIAPIDTGSTESITTPNVKSKIHSTSDDSNEESETGIEYYKSLIDTYKNFDVLIYIINDIAYQLFDQTTKFY